MKSGLIALLLELLQTFWKDPDYILNLSRILRFGKLTDEIESFYLAQN